MNVSKTRQERIELLTLWAHRKLGDTFHPYDKILRQAQKIWPTLSYKTQTSYARAATKAYLEGGVPVQKSMSDYVSLQHFELVTE